MVETQAWQTEFAGTLSTMTTRLKEDFETTDLRSLLIEPLSVSGGEAFSAEEHRGREILELFQNAADQCQERTDSLGAVYIAITDAGLMVANTGSNFDFEDPDTRNALRIFGHSDKDADAIGEFGVGLTALRASGEAYEVWTKGNDAVTDTNPEKADCWRVRCGPENVLAPIAQASEQSAESDTLLEMQTEIRGDPGIFDIEPRAHQPDIPTPEEFPYFLYPLGLQNWESYIADNNPSHLKQRAYELLTDTKVAAETLPSAPRKVRKALDEIGAFTTAVFVEFENSRWRSLYKTLTGKTPGNSVDPKTILNQAWFDGRDNAKLTPELLLMLGDADAVIVEDHTSTEGNMSRYQLWKVDSGTETQTAPGGDIDGVDRDPWLNQSSLSEEISFRRSIGESAVTPAEQRETAEVEGRPVAVNLTTLTTSEQSDSSTKSWRFWEFQFAESRRFGEEPILQTTEDVFGEEIEESPINARMLLPRQHNESLYAPHLYYPISGLNARFPMCLHGEFAVRQDRQGLDGNAIQQNTVVVAELARLVGAAAEALADSDHADTAFTHQLPWQCLPIHEDLHDEQTPTAVMASASQASEQTVVAALVTGIRRRLRHADTIPIVTADETETVALAEADLMIHSSMPVLAGIMAFYQLDADKGHASFAEIASAIDTDFVTPAALKTLGAWLSGNTETTSTEPQDIPVLNGDGTTLASHSADFDQPTWSDVALDEIAEAGGRTNRLTGFLTSPLATDTDDRTGDVFRWWRETLTTWADQYRVATDTGATSLSTPEPVANAILAATMTLATPSDESAPETSRLHEFTSRGQRTTDAGAYLLPCRAPHNESRVELVCVEDHTGQQSGSRRVLHPNADNPDLGGDAGPVFNIYLLTNDAHTKWGANIKPAAWGTRDIDGQPAFFRALVAAAESSDTALTAEGLETLLNEYHEIENRSSELSPEPGSYHSKSFIKALSMAQSADDVPARFRDRLQARRITLDANLLTSIENHATRTLHLPPSTITQWLLSDKSPEGPEHLDSVPEISADAAPSLQPNLPFVQPESGDPLSILGLSLLPDITVITQYRDPASSGWSSWYPLEDEADTLDPRAKQLQKALKTTSTSAVTGTDGALPTYLELLAAPGFSAADTLNHTSHCSIKTNQTNPRSQQVAVASWVWADPETLTQMPTEALATRLEAVGDEWAESVLVSAWNCRYGNGSPNDITTYLPTLLNWQLRTKDGWYDTPHIKLKKPDITADAPGSDTGWLCPNKGWTLTYAIQDEGGRRAGTSASSLLPTVDPDKSALSASTLAALGVKPLEELTAAEAALRLQGLVDATMRPGDAHDRAGVPLFDGASPKGWKTLYEALLDPIVTIITESDRPVSLDEFSYLTHLPVKSEYYDGWVALPLSELGQVGYYTSEPSSWEARVQDANHSYVLPYPTSNKLREGAFTTFAADHTPCTQESPAYPTPFRSATDLPTSLAEETRRLREKLNDNAVKTNILAAAPETDYLQLGQKYDAAISGLVSEYDLDTFGELSGRTWAFQVYTTDAETQLKTTQTLPTSLLQDLRVVVNLDTVDPAAPTKLAELFQAVYDGGSLDSYRLALTGTDVEGVVEARTTLTSVQQQSLTTDLTLATRLLGEPEPNDWPLDDITDYDTARVACGTALKPDDSATESDTNLDNSITALKRTLTAAVPDSCPPGLRKCVAAWLADPDDASAIIREHLSTDIVGAEAAVPNWEVDFLRRYPPEKMQDLLPPRSRDIERFAQLVQSLAATDAVEEIPNVPGVQISWARPVGLALTDTHDHVFADVLASKATWVHVAWWLTKSDTSLTDTQLYAALESALVTVLAGDSDSAEQIRERLTAIITGKQTSTSSNTQSTPDHELLTAYEGNLSEVNIITDTEAQETSLSATGRGTRTVNSEETTKVPRVAELAVLKKSYQGLKSSKLSPNRIEHVCDTLQDDAHMWHTNSGWAEVPTNSGDEWPAIEDLGEIAGTVPGELIDTADEPIVGFDILDVTGAFLPTQQQGVQSQEAEANVSNKYPSEINPVPVEVKCVGSVTAPRFRFTTNQVRRALNFVSESPERPFVIALVELTETTSGQYQCEAVRTQILRKRRDVYELLGFDNEIADLDGVDRVVTDLIRSGHFWVS